MNNKVAIITSYYQDGNKLTFWSNGCYDNLFPGSDLKFHIYRKDNSLRLDHPPHSKENEIVIPNIGRCDYAFLLHIIRNYDELSDINVFIKVNWMDQGNDFLGLLRECQKYDFSDIGQTPELQIWDTDVLDSGYQKYLVDSGFNVNTPIQTIDPRDNKNAGVYLHAFNSDCLQDWYSEIFSNIDPPKPFWSWCHGPCFSVSRDLIRRHPKSVYEYLLSRFMPESNSWDIELGKDVMSRVLNKHVSEEEVMEDVGKHYHDNLLRFWRVLFTHNITSDNFNIKVN